MTLKKFSPDSPQLGGFAAGAANLDCYPLQPALAGGFHRSLVTTGFF